MNVAAATPVHLLTGFLGSGKTTLLRRVLQDPALAGAAVLINEFGEVGLDHHLIERIDETIVLLQSGCLCCTIRGELAGAIRELLAKREAGVVPAFDRLVIESTGLADPFPILSTIRGDPIIRNHFTVGSTIATIDAVNTPAGIDTRPEMRKQIASADRLLVTKTDLVATDDAKVLIERLSIMNPTAQIQDSRSNDWDAAWLIEDGPLFDRTKGDPWLYIAPGVHMNRNRHGRSIEAFSIAVDRPVDWTAFGVWLTMLLNRHGERVLRVKGILNIAGEDRPVAVHGVQHLVHPPTHMAGWPDHDRASRLVFIVDGLDPQSIRSSFKAFVSPEAAPPAMTIEKTAYA